MPRADLTIPASAPEPLWLRGAAIAATLAGVPVGALDAALDADDATALARLARAHAAVASQPGADRVAVARSIARARAALFALPPDPPPSDALDHLGALVLASALRAQATAAVRAQLGRAFDPVALRAAGALAASAPPCDGPALAAAIARLTARLGRAPSLLELGLLAAAALGHDAFAPSAVHGALRATRAAGGRPRTCFAPFARALERGGAP